MYKLCILYAYHETNNQIKRNLKYFLKYGYEPLIKNNIDVTMYLVVNNYNISVDLTKYKNIIVITRENTGYDFYSYGVALNHINESNITYDYYFCINATTTGPFIPKYAMNSINWCDIFINEFKTNTSIKLVGPTIGIDTWIGKILNPPRYLPHVQSYSFMLTDESCKFLQSKGIFNTIYTDKTKLVMECEIGMSILILNNDWRISCLVPEYANPYIDYKNISYDHNPTGQIHQGDILYSGKCCYSRDVHPYEVVFVKTNRDVYKSEIDSLMNQAGI